MLFVCLLYCMCDCFFVFLCVVLCLRKLCVRVKKLVVL